MKKNLDNESCINRKDLNCIECDKAEDWQKLPRKEIVRIRIENIIASAIQLTNGQVFIGKRHSDAQKSAITIMGKSNYLKEKIIKDGFITDRLRFVGREEAYIIAKSNGQFKRYEIQKICGVENGYDGEELYSEDLW
jgi:hypothetical protein